MECVLGGQYAEGKYADEFDKDLRTFYHHTIRYSVLVNSGSSANLLAITTLTDKTFGQRQAKVGDEIITVAAGFPTTINPIIQNGLVPVFVDIDINTLLPDMEVIENAIVEGKTKGVILAHPLGNPFDAETLRDICNEYGIWMVEDNCNGLGGSLHDKYLGSFGDISTLSFGVGGGTCLIQSPMVNQALRSFRDYGCDVQGFNRIGYNLKSTDLQASLLVSYLKKLPWFIEKRRNNWKALREGLDKYKKYFRFMQSIDGANPSPFGFLLSVKESAPFNRRELADYLEAHKIETYIFSVGNILRQPAYTDIECKVFQELTGTDVVANYAFWIGCHPSIGDEQVSYILKTFDKFIEGHKQ